MPQQAQTRPATAGQVYNIPIADVPRTGEEVRALERRIRVMREQLQDAAERRNSVAGNLRAADEQARQGYVDRLKVLDERILGLETEISNSVARLAAAPSTARNEAVVVQTTRPEDIAREALDKVIPVTAILSVFVFFPIAFALARLLWKRASVPKMAAGPDRATQDRLEQLQQSMDAIAIEVERISEGQRFVTKLMSERQIGSGAAEPISQKQAARSEVR